MGNSGRAPERASESRFVADEDPGRLDVAHPIVASGQVVTVGIETTRCVGTVDPDGFLTLAQQHIDQGTLAETLLLTVRAQIAAVDAGGTLGIDGLEVEVVLHKGTGHERSLGKLEGDFGTIWQDFHLDVDVRDVKFPADPCPGQLPSESCGRDLEPASNEVGFVFSGSISRGMGITMEVDWLTLEPKSAPGLAWRPVLLVHGLGATSASMRAGTAWPAGLLARDVASYAVDLTPKGSIIGNGAELAPLVGELKRRFGVERVHILGHSKGGIDAREYTWLHNDVEVLLMLAAPNEGSFVADMGALVLGRPGQIGEYFGGSLSMGRAYMRFYNLTTPLNPKTIYVAAAGDHDGPWANKLATLFGANDHVAAVSSVHALHLSHPFTDRSSDGFTDHSGMRFNTRVVDALFPAWVAALTAQVAAAGEAQILTSDAGIAAGGVTAASTVVLDQVGEVFFLMLGDQDALRFELVSPSGSRIDPSTPLTDPALTATAYRDEGSLSYAGYHVQAPEAGSWTLEVTGTGVPSPDGGVYAVSALAPLVPGVGVVLAAAADELRAAGSAVPITATVTEDGQPVTDATVEAVVAHPDGATMTLVALTDDGAGGDPAAGDDTYTGSFTATEPGLYAVVVPRGGRRRRSRASRCCRSPSPPAPARSRG